MTDGAIALELDARHAEAQAAFARRDAAAYAAMFSPALAYRQPDGRVIGREQLLRDVEAQFRNTGGAVSTFARERLSVAGAQAVELLTQTAYFETSAFGLIHLRWRLTRRGEYTWTRENGAWVIVRVDVLAESIGRVGWRLGF
jgi:hypothetical protein